MIPTSYHRLGSSICMERVYKLNNTETEMTGMKPKDAIKLNQVSLVNRENYPPEDTLPADGCIAICYNLVKNMMINVKEQWIGYGLKRLTD